MFEKRSLGISFEADGTVRAVELTSGVRTVTLSGVWTMEPEGSDAFDSWRQGLEGLRKSGVGFENLVIGIPDSLLYRKHLSFPFRGRRRIMQILASELEGEIPLSVDEVVADFIEGQTTGSGVYGTAMACDRSTLSRFLDLVGPTVKMKSVQTGSVGLAAVSLRAGMKDGLSVHCGTAEALLVEFRSSRVKTVKRLVLNGDAEKRVALLVDGLRQYTENGDEVYLACAGITDEIISGLAGDETLKFRTFSDLSAVHLAERITGDQGESLPAIGLALSGLGAGETMLFDLRQGPFKQETPLAGLKGPLLRTCALGVIVIFLAIGGLVTGLNQVRGEYFELKDRLENQFKGLFPDSRLIEGQETVQIRGELEGLKKKVAELSGLEGHGGLSVLAALSAAIPEDVSLKLDELSYDSKKLRLEGSVSSFDTVDRIKGALDKEPFFTDVQVQNARVGADINKVTFRLQMEVR